MAVDEEESRRAGRSFQQFVFDAEFAAEVEELGSAAEALRAELQEEAVAALGAYDAAGMSGSFGDVGVDAGFAQVEGAGQAGDSGADDENWYKSGHEVRKPSYHLETVRLERVKYPHPGCFVERVRK